MMAVYDRADTDWLAGCALGVGVHWTAQTVPRHGSAVGFADAVAQFQVDRFLADVDRAGADYIIFTLAHALQMLPCPHPVMDDILPGRTAERDLLGEIARGLESMGKKLIVYYNHSCNHADDPAWEQAVGYHEASKDRFVENLFEIVGWLGGTYGELIPAWWFDSSYSVDPCGPHNSVSTDMTDFQFPWEAYTRTAKTGHAGRLVTYNAGVAQTFLYTDHQDYWAGELTSLDEPPTGRYLESGLQWHGWTCLDDRRWVYKDNSTVPAPPIYSDEELRTFLRECRRHQCPMCFNIVSFQDGTLAEESVDQLQRISQVLTDGVARRRE